MKKTTWSRLAAFTLGGIAAGLITRTFVARRREASGHFPMNEYERYAARLRFSHEALRRNLDHAVELIDHGRIQDRKRFGEFIALYGRFLILHHDAEEHAIFPALRRSSSLRSADAVHLDRWGGEHREINAAAAALVAARSDLAQLRQRCRELREMLEPHLLDEEAVLTATHLPEMISERELAAAQRAVRGEREAGPLMSAFLARSLSPEEREAVFGDAPWVFRSIILPQVSRLGMRAYEPFVLYPA